MTRKIILCMAVIVAGISGCYAGVNDIYAYQDTPNGPWGFCDYWGEVIIPPKYEHVYRKSFTDFSAITEWAAVLQNGKYGFIDKNGNIKIGFKYNRASNFHHGHAAVEDDNNNWGLIDEKGEFVITPKYSNIIWSEDDEIWIIYKSIGNTGKWKEGLIDKSGRLIAQPQFDHISSFREGLACVEMNGKSGYIDRFGNIVIDIKFDNACSFNENLAAVKIKGYWGFIDKSGNCVIPARYTHVDRFSEGLAYASINYIGGYIDKRGSFVIEPRFQYGYRFSEGLAPIKINDKCGYIDKYGKIVIKPQFFNAFEFKSGYAIVIIKDNSTDKDRILNGVINKSGLYVVLPEYRVIYGFEDGISFVEKEVITESSRSKVITGYIDYSGNFYSNLRDALKAVHRR